MQVALKIRCAFFFFRNVFLWICFVTNFASYIDRIPLSSLFYVSQMSTCVLTWTWKQYFDLKSIICCGFVCGVFCCQNGERRLLDISQCKSLWYSAQLYHAYSSTIPCRYDETRPLGGQLYKIYKQFSPGLKNVKLSPISFLWPEMNYISNTSEKNQHGSYYKHYLLI
jgi:hypothetical protein